MRHKALWVLIFIAAVAAIMFWAAGGSSIKDEMPYYLKKIVDETGTVTIRGTTVEVEIARTASAREKGLSNRSSLPYERGMLFVFDQEGEYPFTMSEMSFPLDIIWIRENTVVATAFQAQPGEENIDPGTTAVYVLEVNSNFGQRSNWQVGDEVTITFDKE